MQLRGYQMRQRSTPRSPVNLHHNIEMGQCRASLVPHFAMSSSLAYQQCVEVNWTAELPLAQLSLEV